jgi:hypothetical protein
MEKLHLTFYETPRHGYLEVSGDICRKLKISQRFSVFSHYFSIEDEEDPDFFEDTFFLEEDIDAQIFFQRCTLDKIEVILTTQYLTAPEENAKILCHGLIADNEGDQVKFGKLEQHSGLIDLYSDKEDLFDDEEDSVDN